MFPDCCPVLVDAIVVAGNHARPDVGSFAHFGVAEIGQVTGLGALAQLCLLGLHKVAHVRVFANLAPRPQMRERADLCAIAHRALGEHTALPDEHIVAQRAVLNHREGPDQAFGADSRLSQQLHKRFNHRIGGNFDIGVDHACLGPGDRHSGRHQPRRCFDPQLPIFRHQFLNRLHALHSPVLNPVLRSKAPCPIHSASFCGMGGTAMHHL